MHFAALATIILTITATQSEHSKDSSSRTTTIEVTASRVLVSYARGGHGPREATPPVDRKLDAAGNARVQKLVEDSGLLAAKDVDQKLDGPGVDYGFDLTVDLDGKPGKLHLHGPLSDWRGEGKRAAPPFAQSAAYQAALKLVADLEAVAKAP